jgi:hypothetical protein
MATIGVVILGANWASDVLAPDVGATLRGSPGAFFLVSSRASQDSQWRKAMTQFVLFSIAVSLTLPACKSDDSGTDSGSGTESGSGADAGEYDCTVAWTDNGMVVGMADLSYSALQSADEAVMKCEEDQADHPARPATADGYSCDCSAA